MNLLAIGSDGTVYELRNAKRSVSPVYGSSWSASYRSLRYASGSLGECTWRASGLFPDSDYNFVELPR